MKKNKRQRGIYMLTAACLLIGAIGGVTAYENRPDQKVPDLQLTVGQSGYDLMAGITYDSEKYTLSVVDTGGLDINRIGKYEVTYALTPLEVPSTEEIPDTTEVPSTEVIPDTTEVPSTETVPGQTPDQTQPPSTETAPGTTPDQSGTPDTSTPGAGTSPDQTGTPDAGTTPGAGTSPDQTETPDAGTTSGTTTDKTDTPASGTVTNDPLGGELEEAQPEDNSGASAKPTDISAVAESIFGTVRAAEITDTQTEGVKYLTRTVWVVAGTDSIFIGYEEEDVKIKANEALYELVLIEDDAEQTTETEQTTEAEQSDVTGETGTQTETIGETEATEQTEATEDTEPQYELVLKKPELLTEGIRVTDSAASLYNGATVTVTDDSELKNAVNIETAEDGTKTIKNINFGTYTIEVTAEDQSTGKKASCTRTVTVEGIRFDAPTLYIGTQNTEYDLTADMSAVDESGNNAEIYVINEDELTAARETVTDEETGEEKTQFIKGTYHVTLGAKHPVTGEEFTIEREVQITDGYYIYAPTLYVMAGDTDYDLLEGVELRDTDTQEAVENAEIVVEDMSDLYRSLPDGDVMADMAQAVSLAEEDGTPAGDVAGSMPALTAGEEYTVTLAAEDPGGNDNPLTVQRSVAVASESIEKRSVMNFEAVAYRDRLLDANKNGTIYNLSGSYNSKGKTDEFSKICYNQNGFGANGFTNDAKWNEQEFQRFIDIFDDCDQYLQVTEYAVTARKLKGHNSIYTNDYAAGMDMYLFKYQSNENSLLKNMHGEIEYTDLLYTHLYPTATSLMVDEIVYPQYCSRNQVKYLHGLDGSTNRGFLEMNVPEGSLAIYQGNTYPGTSVTANLASYNYYPVVRNGFIIYHAKTGGFQGYAPYNNLMWMNDNPLSNLAGYNGGKFKYVKGDWNYYVKGERDKWNEADAEGLHHAGDIKTMRNGGEPDVKLTPFAQVNNINLDIYNLVDTVENITKESSIMVDGTGQNYLLPSTTQTGADTIPMILPPMQYAMKGFQLVNNSAPSKVGYTLQDGTYFKLENMIATANAADVGNNWKIGANDNTNGSGDFEFVANGGTATVNLYSQHQKNVILKQDGDHSNTVAVGYYHNSLTLNVSDGKSKFLTLTTANATKGNGNNTRLILKGNAGVVSMTSDEGSLGWNTSDRGKITAGIIDVQTTSGRNMTIQKSASQSDTEPVITVYNKLMANGRKIIVGQSDGKPFTEGEVIAKSYGEKLNAADFVTDAVNRQKNIYPANLDDHTIVAKTRPESIEVLKPDSTVLGKYMTYKDAVAAITADAKTGEYTIRNLDESSFNGTDAAALQAFSQTGVSLKFVSGSRSDNVDGNRYRINFEIQEMQLPKSLNVTFEDILITYDGMDGKQLAIVNNGGQLKFGTNVSFLKADADGEKEGRPVVYGGSTSGTNDAASTVIINSGSFAAVYGAGSVPQTKGTNVTVSGGSVDKLFAGGTKTGTVTGDTVITVIGGAINCPIYGGGEGAKVTGNTKVIVTGGDFDKSSDRSVYGGGKGADVEGKSDVLITIDNSAGGKTLLCNNVSASGTDENGTLIDNVKNTGAKNTITITSKVSGDRAKKAALELDRLTGFDTLTMGNDAETENNNFMIAVNKRFDSRVVDSAQDDNERDDTVILKSMWLKMLGDWQGHIGYLNTMGKCALTIYKDGNGTKPLLIDQIPTLDRSAANKVQLKASNGVNDMGDVMVTFTFREEKSGDVPNSYLPASTYACFEDGLDTGLKVKQTQTGTGADTDFVNIIFAIPKTHTATGFVEYPVENGKVILDEKGKTNKKILHFTYDKQNEHNVLGGYVVALPKTAVANAAAGNAEEMLKYTTTDSTFKTNGTSFTAATQALNPVKIKFTQNTNAPGTNGAAGTTVYEAYGFTVDDSGNKKAIDIDNENYWYVAHIVCTDQDAYTFLVDVEAPEASAGTLQVVGSELDTKTGNYIYTVEVVDPSETSEQKLPYYMLNKRTKKYLTYNGNGVGTGYYSLTETLDKANDAADVEAGKSLNTKWNVSRPVTGETTGLYDTVEVTKRDGGKPVPGNTPARITATIPRKLVEDNRTGAVWAYAKDELNNTVKVQIPLNDYIIDVSVPMEVNVIAVKKPDGGYPELLAPACYIVNNGMKEIQAKISGFATTPQPNLKLSGKAKTDIFNADEIALFIKGIDGNTFAETNVLTLDHTPLGIGTLGKASEDTRTKAYTFDAAYDVKNINVPDGFIRNTMSYHFSVVQGGN